MRIRVDRGPHCRSRGAGTLEYVAALGLAALMVAALALSAPGLQITVMFHEAICTIRTAVGIGGGSCGTTPEDGGQPPTRPPLDPKPKKCKVSEHSEKVNAAVKIGFVKIGENAGFVRMEYTDKSVTYTATDGAEVGLTGGFGTKLDVGKVQRGAKVDFGAGVKYDYGSTWTFKDDAEATGMRDQLDDYLMEQEQLKHNPEYAIKFLWSDAKKPPKPPSQLVSTIETTADVSGTLGLSLPFGPAPPAGSEDDRHKLTLAEAGVKFGTSGKWTQITDTVTGATTYTTGGETYDQRNGAVGPYEREVKNVVGSSMAITRDKDNHIIKVTLVTTREGTSTDTTNLGQGDLGGKASDGDGASHLTVTTASLDVTPQDRGLVDDWLAAQQSDPTGYVSPETLYPDKVSPGDPFQNLMFTNATVSNVQYDNVSDKSGFAAEVKVGVALGIDVSLETSDSKAVAASYLDIPGGDGTRAPVNFSECVAQ